MFLCYFTMLFVVALFAQSFAVTDLETKFRIKCPRLNVMRSKLSMLFWRYATFTAGIIVSRKNQPAPALQKISVCPVGSIVSFLRKAIFPIRVKWARNFRLWAKMGGMFAFHIGIATRPATKSLPARSAARVDRENYAASQADYGNFWLSNCFSGLRQILPSSTTMLFANHGDYYTTFSAVTEGM